MREQDRREVLATANLSSMTECGALSFLSSPETTWCAWIDGQPVAAFGYAPVSALQPHLYSAWAWGTDLFKRVAPALTRFAVANWPKAMIGAGALRCEVRSLQGHDLAHKWLTALRCRYEATLVNYGTGGETFELWAWIKDDWNDVLFDQNQ